MLTHCRTIVCAGVLLAAACVPASAQPAFQAACSGGQASGDPIDFTCSFTGSDRLLLCAIGWFNAGQTIAGVTYSGAGLTQITGSPFPQTTIGYIAAGYFLIAPSTTATQTLSVDMSAPADVTATCANYTGVHQTVPLDTLAEATGTTADPTVTVSSATGDLVVSLVAYDGETLATTNIAADAPATERLEQDSNLFNTAIADEAGDTSVSSDWTINISADWSMGAISVNPVGGAAAPRPPCLLQLLGLGRC